MPIRDATPDDFQAVQELYRQLLAYEAKDLNHNVNPEFAYQDYGVECLTGFVADNVGTLVVVYEEDGEIRGYASLRDVPWQEVAHKNDVKMAEITTIAVDIDHRNKGIGRALIAECQRIARVNKYSHLQIISLAQNDRANHLYEGCGFKPNQIIHEMKL